MDVNCSGLALLAVGLNMVGCWLCWQEARQYRQLKRQYQAYVERLESVVQQLEGR